MYGGENSPLITCLKCDLKNLSTFDMVWKMVIWLFVKEESPADVRVWRKEFGQNMQIQKALHRIRFTRSINSTFLQMYLELCASNRRLEKMFTGTTIKHLTGEKLARMTIPICSIDEQNQILLELESKFSEIDQLDQTLTTALQQAEALRQSILKKAFSGQLVPQDPSDEPASVLLERIQAEKAALIAPIKGKKKNATVDKVEDKIDYLHIQEVKRQEADDAGKTLKQVKQELGFTE